MRKGTQTFATKKEVGETNQLFIGTFDFHTAEISRIFLYRISLIWLSLIFERIEIPLLLVCFLFLILYFFLQRP